MAKKRVDKHNQSGGITHKRDKNAGSGAFNQGSEQDAAYDQGVKLTDEEKRRGTRSSRLGKEKENPKDGNIGKTNAGGYK